MKERRLFVAGFLLIILAGIVIALVFRGRLSSFIVTDQSIADFSVYTHSDESLMALSYTDLIDKADIIVLASLTGTRTFDKFNMYAEVDVAKVFKGPADELVNTRIWVCEPASMNISPYNPSISLNGTTNIMQTDQSYLLLLKFHSKPAGYQYTDRDLKMYLLADQYYGQFPSEIHGQPVVINEKSTDNKIWKYGELVGIDCIVGSLDIFDDYCRLRNELFNYFKNIRAN